MKKLLVVLFFTLTSSLFTLCEAQYTDLYNFVHPFGVYSHGSLTYSAGKFYGMTSAGGPNYTGSIFCIDSNGNNVKDLWDFDGIGSNGEYPQCDLLLIKDKLYGMTSNGGTGNWGVIFSIDTNGSNYTTLWSFDDTGTNGAQPLGDLTLLGGKFYGMTQIGGTNNGGLIFSIDTSGSGYKDLWNFDDTGSNGYQPYGSLIYSLGKFYGMTSGGGVAGNGNVFSIDSNGLNYKNFYSFTATGPRFPYGSLLLSGKVLYGMTCYTVGHSWGNIFSIDTDGSNYNDLYNFSTASGGSPEAALILSGGRLYGTASANGPYGDGDVFYVDTNGSGFGILFAFNNTNGEIPEGDVTLLGNNIYGTASRGGLNTVGVIFRYGLVNNSASIITNVSCHGGSNGSITANTNGGIAPYTYAWAPSGATTGTITGLNAGTYTLTVTDTTGYSAVSTYTITQPVAISATHDSTADNGSSNGSAGVVASGGTTPYTYLWNPGSGTTATISGLSAGTYTCTIEDNNGCSYTTSVTVKSSTGINTIAASAGNITVYPNPGNGVFTFVIASEALSTEQAGKQSYPIIEVYNVLGEQVCSNYQITKSSNYQIDMSSNPNGIYFYRVLSNTGELVGEGKVVIQK